MVTASRGRISASKRGLHQTHLRGLPSRRCRRLDCGEAVAVSFRIPRRALEIQPYRHVGQNVIQNDGLILAWLERSGDPAAGVLVHARLDARAAVARILRLVLSKNRHGPGANQTQGGRALHAWRRAGSLAQSVGRSADAGNAFGSWRPSSTLSSPDRAWSHRTSLIQHFFPAAAPSR
jgi:hypothetical protein